MLEEKKYDPLNPDSEQQLFEKLSLPKEDQDMLEYIRKDMRALRKYEQIYNGKQSNNG